MAQKRKTDRRRNWSAREDARLRKDFPTKPMAELSRTFDRSEDSIRHRAKTLGIKRERTAHTRNKVWTEQEDQFLRQNANTASLRAIANIIGRSQTACRHRMKALGLSPTKVFDPGDKMKVRKTQDKNKGERRTLKLPQLTELQQIADENVRARALDLHAQANILLARQAETDLPKNRPAEWPEPVWHLAAFACLPLQLDPKTLVYRKLERILQEQEAREGASV